jgi:uncharacterized protein YabE (DUF348 family)
MMSSSGALTQSSKKIAEHALPPLRRPSQAGLVAIIALFVLGNSMIMGYISMQREATLVINDHSFAVRTHQTSVAALLDELGIQLAPEDILMSPLDAPLQTK